MLISLMSTCTNILDPCVVTHDFVFPSPTKLVDSLPFGCIEIKLFDAILSVIRTLDYFSSYSYNKGNICSWLQFIKDCDDIWYILQKADLADISYDIKIIYVWNLCGFKMYYHLLSNSNQISMKKVHKN